MKLAIVGQNENQKEKRRKTWSSGKLSADMIKVIASSLRQLQRTGLLVITNDQQFVDAQVENKKLVIRLKDK